MAQPKPAPLKKSSLQDSWRVLKAQWGLKDVKLRIVPRGGDPDAYFNFDTNTVTLNMERIRETAAAHGIDPIYWAKAAMRHEVAHWQQLKVDPRLTSSEHGGRFPYINRSIQGAENRPLGQPMFPGRGIPNEYGPPRPWSGKGAKG